MRALRLAEALETEVRLSVDGPVPRLGMPGAVRLAAGGPHLLRTLRPALLVLDTPVEADGARWVRAARRLGVTVASIHDRGIAPVESDLAIDGSLAGPARVRGAARTLKGPRFMVVDPRVAEAAERGGRGGRHIVVAFGGGARRALAGRVARAVRRAVGDVRIQIAGGFEGAPRAAVNGIEWLGPQPSLVPFLQAAAVAVLGGGVTLYEAAALGVPVVAMAVVPAQRPTVRAFAQGGLALAAGTPRDAAASVARLLSEPSLRRSVGRRGCQAIDGRGTTRVAGALRALLPAGA